MNTIADVRAWLDGTAPLEWSKGGGAFIVADPSAIVRQIPNSELLQRVDCEVIPPGLSPFVSLVLSLQFAARQQSNWYASEDYTEMLADLADLAAIHEMAPRHYGSPVEVAIDSAEIANAVTTLPTKFARTVESIVGGPSLASNPLRGRVLVVICDFGHTPINQAWCRAALRLRHRKFVWLFTGETGAARGEPETPFDAGPARNIEVPAAAQPVATRLTDAPAPRWRPEPPARAESEPTVPTTKGWLEID